MLVSVAVAMLAALPVHMFTLAPRMGYWVDSDSSMCWVVGRKSETWRDTAWSIERVGRGAPLRMSSWVGVPVPEGLPREMLGAFGGSSNAAGQMRMVGWPARCLWGGVLFDRQLGIPGSPTAVVRQPVHLFEPARMSGMMKGRGIDGGLPVGIVWRGLMLDTLVYGAACWALAVAPRLARRLGRKRKGRCVGCGYDLTGSAARPRCPECGRPMVSAQGLQASSGSAG